MSRPVRQLTSAGYAALKHLAATCPGLFLAGDSQQLRSAAETQLASHAADTPRLFTGRRWQPQANLSAISTGDKGGPDDDHTNARLLRQALPQLTAADAADPRVLASINCFHLAEYCTIRWKTSKLAKRNPASGNTQKSQAGFVAKHWLHRHKESNTTARLWWLAEFAERAAPHSAHSSDQLLDLMAGNRGLYHRLLAHSVLMASDRIRALVMDTAADSGLLSTPGQHAAAQAWLSALNRRAGLVCLDALNHDALRETIRDCLPPKD